MRETHHEQVAVRFTTYEELVRNMANWLPGQRCGPIGVDIGSRSVKLLQFDAARTRVHDAARWDLPPEPAAKPERQDERVVEAIRHAREGRNFRGREAVLCLGAGNLFVQNIRVSQATGDELTKIVHFEAAGRLPFASEEAEIRYIEADDVRQGDTVRREVILLACHRPSLERMLSVAEQAGLRPWRSTSSRRPCSAATAASSAATTTSSEE